MIDERIPPCPRCHSRKRVYVEGRNFWCSACKVCFDADPDEGGDWSDGNPAARLEREERRREKHGGRR